MIKDEIKENLKSMSLGDHLEELRARLILIILGIVVGLIITLFFGGRLVAFLEIPYYRAVLSADRMPKDTEHPSPETEISSDTLVNVKISERNARSIQSLKPGDSFLASIEYYRDDPNNPAFGGFKDVYSTDGSPTDALDPRKGLQTIEPSEGLLVYLKVCLVFGIVLVSPWIFWQLWIFISAGLYRYERKFVHIVAPISGALFILGALFFIGVVAPLAMGFFIRFNKAMGVASNWTLRSYMSFVLVLTLVFGAAFQMPIAIVFAEMMGLVSIEMLTKNRKYVVLGLLFIAAVATPPDVISQVLLATPLYVLYEGSIVVCRLMRKKREQST